MKILSRMHEYEVCFDQNIAAARDAWAGMPDKIFCVDGRVIESVGADLKGQSVYRIDACEEEKSLAGAERLLMWMQQNGVHRGTTVIAIGGGVTQDIVAFASHMYFRGVSWWFLPTTLLSQADSCIGSKYAVNLGGRKNQIGGYFPPKKVFVVNDFLKTLPLKDLMSGYGEIFRLMWTGSRDSFYQFAQEWRAEGVLGPNLTNVIRRGLEIKKNIVEKDEIEQGPRRILNYGHTFGHALEVLTDHRVPHGLAVVWGMDFIDAISGEMGLLNEQSKREKRDLSRKIFAPAFAAIPDFKSRIDKITGEDLISVIKLDKKSTKSQIQLILNAGAGDLRVVPMAMDNVLLDHIKNALEELR